MAMMGTTRGGGDSSSGRRVLVLGLCLLLLQVETHMLGFTFRLQPCGNLHPQRRVALSKIMLIT